MQKIDREASSTEKFLAITLPKRKLDLKRVGKLNYPLVFGSIILLALLIMSFFPSLFTSHDPYFSQGMIIKDEIINGEHVQKVLFPPIPPNPRNILGTDDIGRDNYARLIYGAKATLYACIYITLVRFLVALPMGLWAGLGGKIPKFLIKQFNTIFTAIPPVVVCFIVLNIQYLAGLQIEKSIKAFAVVFAVVGWGKLANLIEQKSYEIYKQDFIEGKIAIGKSKLSIAFKNIVPHLIPVLISYFFVEVAMVLFLQVQLSVLYVFIGPRFRYRDDVRGEWMMAVEPEWSSMLSRAVISRPVGAEKFWMSIVPTSVFAFAILGFNFFGEGLRIEFDKRNSMIVTWLRKIPLLISPRIFYEQVREFRSYRAPVIVKGITYITVLALILIPAPKSRYPFDSELTMTFIKELSSSTEDITSRVTGTKGGYLAGDNIVEKLKGYGLQPLVGNSYYMYYDLGKKKPLINGATITINEKTFLVNEDFVLQSIDSNLFTQAIEFDEDRRVEDKNDENEEDLLYNTVTLSREFIDIKTANQMHQENRKMIFDPIDLNTPNQRTIQDFKSVARDYKIDTIVMESSREKFDNPITPSIYSETVIWASTSMSQCIKDNINSPLELNLEIFKDSYKNYGRNIFAILPGTDSKNDSDKEQYLLIGAGYDSDSSPVDVMPMATHIASTATSLGIASTLGSIPETPKTNIVFAFWDGTFNKYSGINAYKNSPIFNLSEQSVFYIDIGPIASQNVNELTYSFASPRTHGDSSFDFIKYTKKRLGHLDIKNKLSLNGFNSFKILTPYNSFNIGFSSFDSNTALGINDKVDNLEQKMIKKFGQLVLDILLQYCYQW